MSEEDATRSPQGGEPTRAFPPHGSENTTPGTGSAPEAAGAADAASAPTQAFSTPSSPSGDYPTQAYGAPTAAYPGQGQYGAAGQGGQYGAGQPGQAGHYGGPAYPGAQAGAGTGTQYPGQAGQGNHYGSQAGYPQRGNYPVRPRNTVPARAGSTAARAIPAGNMAAPATRAARAISTPAQVARTDLAARMVRAGVIRSATVSSPSRAKPACLLVSAWESSR
ncbi:hypothetical protein QP117_06335 [Actinotignum timonense]|uniref:hypothetical protein n=1 Tax=Actinotignum timonense TaxID=1870995 RepID=UPI00255195E7|nr:hypothetical protein [Actinotignum timonense]MDK6419299.1 hypothetical protein [Actinotignum timonense]